jgi:hypothetical protein
VTTTRRDPADSEAGSSLLQRRHRRGGGENGVETMAEIDAQTRPVRFP